MDADTRADDLFAAWYARRERGEDAEGLLREHPDLAPAIRERIAALALVDLAVAGAPPTTTAPPPPEHVGSYRILRELGAGGMGTVYLAEDRRGRAVALKLLHPHLLHREGFFKRFLREADLGRRVDHANVVRTLDADATAEGDRTHHFLVMEYVEGQTLRELLEELERVPEELCRHVAREIARGLAAIHAAGAVHRDLKPENVLITKDHRVKVMDLGVARLQDEAIRLSQTGAFVGSLQYAAPEQISGRGAVDGRADLHALGLVLYELSAGVHPYGDDDASAVLRKVLDETPRRCAELNPQLSPFFEEVVHTLLAKDPVDRFGTADALLLVLDEGERSAWWRERAQAIRVATKRPLRRVRIPRETALYGRDAELAKLRSLWDDAKAGKGRVLLVEGEAGIGKSRLVDEFVGLLTAEGADLHFLFGSYPPGGAATASGAFSTAYREQFGADGCAAHLAQTPLLVPAFDALLRGEPAPSGSEPLTKDSLQTVFVHATRNLAAERPTIVLIDDLHFAPEEGRALFASLALAVPGHRVLLVGTMRPGVPEKWTASVTRLEHTTHLAVPRLGPKDLVHLLRDAFRSEHLAHELAGRIAEKSDGNPFFVFEIIRGLREGQFLRQRPDGTWETTQILRDITVPSSVLDLVNARVADLDEAERDLLDVAACIGFEFDAGVVADAAGTALLPALKRLGQVERKHRLVRASGRTFVFDHHQVREALCAALSEPLREQYHAAIGDALERRSGAATREPRDLDGALCVDLAEHFLRGAEPGRGVRYLDAALAELKRTYAAGRLVALAERALEPRGLLCGRARFDVLRAAAYGDEFLGDLAAIGRRLDESRAVAESLGDGDLRARVDTDLAPLVFGRSRPEECIRACTSALASFVRSGQRREAMAAEGALGLALLFAGRYDDSRAHFERQLSLAAECGGPREEARAQGNLGLVALSQGDCDRSRALQERALALAREAGDRRLEAIATGNLGCALGLLGRPEEAGSCHERDLDVSRRIGDRRGEVRALGNLANGRYDLRRYEEALALQERVLDLSREMGLRLAEATTLGALGNTLAHLDRLDDARRMHERHLALSREIADREGEARAVGNVGFESLRAGRLADALRLFEESLAIACALGARIVELQASRLVASTLRALGRFAEARRHATRSLDLARTSGSPAAQADALDVIARLGRDEGRASAAEHAFRDAIDLQVAHGLRDDEAATRCALAVELARAGRGEEAAAQFASVRTLRDQGAHLGPIELCALAAYAGADAGTAAAETARRHARLGVRRTMACRFLLFRARGDAADLAEAKRLLDFLVEHAPPDCRESMLTNVRLHREIAAAARDAGIGTAPAAVALPTA